MVAHSGACLALSASNISGLEFDPLAHSYVKTFRRIICQYDLMFDFNINESHCGLFSIQSPSKGHRGGPRGRVGKVAVF